MVWRAPFYFYAIIHFKTEQMPTVHKAAFKVIGMKIRTTNANQQATKDIPKLWERFMTEQTVAKIPNKVEASILCIYTNYEKDHTTPYDTIIGCRVHSLASIPEGMIGLEFEGGTYHKVIAKGNLLEGVVYNAWKDIWHKNLNRAYTADFEVYDEKAQDPTHAEVDIFVAIP
jgi:predicted transcriptional regulator YdeE